MATGIYEELVFRGYAFRRSPERQPRLVIITSAVCFALMHCINLSYEPLRAVLLSISVIFVIALGFGIIRIVTRSLAWCMLIHGTTDAAWQFARAGGHYQKLFPYIVGACGLASVMTLFMHPKLRPRTLCSDES